MARKREVTVVKAPAGAILLTLLMVAVVLAGCATGGDDGTQAQDHLPDLTARLLDDGAVAVDVNVHVVLIGFEGGLAATLGDRLAFEEVRHVVGSANRLAPPGVDNAPLWSVHPSSLVPTARFVVHEADADTVGDYRNTLTNASSETDVYNANAVEAWLAEDALPGLGVPVEYDGPVLVFVHGDANGDVGEHAFRYTYANGWLEPVRVFGERHPVLIMDISARIDPMVQYFLENSSEDPTNPDPPRSYDYVVREPGGERTVAVLEEAVRDAVHHRLLQGPLYPSSTASCHAVTLVLGVRAGGLAEAIGPEPRGADLVDVAALERAFRNLTRADDVHMDLLVLELPLDDAVLDAVSRPTTYTWAYNAEAFRTWVDMNWERYWVHHEGCEAYVSFVILGDAADAPSWLGIAYYDVNEDRRVSFSMVPDLDRLQRAHSGSVFNYDPVNYLFSHETGHLFGLHHPHNALVEDSDPVWGQLWEGEFRNAWGFSSVWSSMSYQAGMRTLDFGVMDQSNFARARAGYAVQEAIQAGHANAPEVEEALRLMGTYDWEGAWGTLLPLLGEAR